ncbi:MAG: hypothetical protein ACI90A_001173 [Shewanella sp.]|jgi:hypothetical protein
MRPLKVILHRSLSLVSEGCTLFLREGATRFHKISHLPMMFPIGQFLVELAFSGSLKIEPLWDLSPAVSAWADTAARCCKYIPISFAAVSMLPKLAAVSTLGSSFVRFGLIDLISRPFRDKLPAGFGNFL